MSQPYEIDETLFETAKASRKRLTARDERYVRGLRGEMTQKTIAAIYGVSVSTIRRAQRRAS
jgi:Trp operon repressor